MDSNLLKVFLSVVNNKSISLGAKELNFTQSNVTLRIKQLEKNLGYKLFHRVPKGVELTKEGHKLYPHAVEIVKKIEEALLQMRNINYLELLKIGSTQSSSTIRLLPFIKKINKDYPNMKLEIYTNTTPLILQSLLDFKIDIAFISGNPNHKDIKILKKFDEEIFMIKAKNKKTQNCILAYKESCKYYTYLNQYLNNQDKVNYKVMFFENFETILGCVSSGIGFSLVPKSIIEKYGYLDNLELIKIDDSKELNTHMICRKDNIPYISEYLKNIHI